MKSRTKIDIDYVKSALDYCRETGRLTWIIRPAKGVNSGDRAGCEVEGGYRLIKIKGKMFKEHRIAWAIHYGEQPPDYIDHVNGIKNDNRILNLSEITQAKNIAKGKMHVGNTSGSTGVARVGKLWRAYITIDKEWIYLGTYKTKSRAEAIYIAARVAAGRWVNV